MRVGSVSREEVWASAGVQGAWVGVGVDVKPIRACLCLLSQRPFLLWCSPAGAVKCTA